MGTSSGYTGAGDKAGRETRDGLNEWLDSLSGSTDDGDGTAHLDETVAEKPVTQLPPKLVNGLMGLLRPRSTRGDSSDGSSAGDGGLTTKHGRVTGGSSRTRAGSGRSSRRLAFVSGRAAAGAYAYVRGDEAELRSLGLDYGELRAFDDPIEVTRRIVDAVCDQQAPGTLEEAEERYVAASVADWVLEQGKGGELPDVDDVARYAIATICVEVLSSEIGEALRNRPDSVADVADDELREAATVLAGQAELSASGPTADELIRAIQEGVDKLRQIYGGGS